MYDVHLPAHLDEWLPRIERQLDLALAPLESLIGALAVRMETVTDPADASLRYLCEFDVLADGGRRHRIAVEHADGLTAVQDAAARVRRELVRGRRLR
jgi:hypothetical protein